jgi:alanyl-tRNA synthetase
MNQFKPIFLGTIGQTEAFASLKRAVDTQKVCFDQIEESRAFTDRRTVY